MDEKLLLAGLAALVINIGVWAIFSLYWAMYAMPRGIIPVRLNWQKMEQYGYDRTKGVPYSYDYWSGLWGDLVALSLVDIAAIVTVVDQGFAWWISSTIPVAAVFTYLWFLAATNPRRVSRNIDWWFEAGTSGTRKDIKINLGGFMHLGYMTYQWTLALVAVIYAFVLWDMHLTMMVVGIVGGVGYGVTWYLDWKQGHFA